MKEIRITFYKSNRKNAKSKIKSYAIYGNIKNGKNKFSKTMDFYDCIDRIAHSEYKYITIATTDYNAGCFFNDFSKFYLNTLDIAESRRSNTENKTDLIEAVKTIYYYMILLGSDFDTTYNPFKDSNVIYHLGKF